MCPLRVPLPHVHRFRDRHGRMRFYLRLPGRPKVALPGDPEAPEFVTAYHAAMAAPPPPKAPVKPAGPLPGSLDALSLSYYASRAFGQHSASTRATYRRVLDRLRDTHGREVFGTLTPAVVRGMMRQLDATPAMANMLLRVLRLVAAHGIETEALEADPTAGVKRLRYKSKPHPPWTEADVRQYEARWPSGTRERLALALLLYTTQRRSDVVRMGRHMMEGGRLVMRQQKGGRALVLAIHPALEAEIAQHPARVMFLVTEAGAPFSPNGFYNWFVDRVAMAGLRKGLGPHGLRKAGLRRIADGGGTPHQIKAVGGHKTLAMVQHYTEDADQARLAEEAMRLMPGGGSRTPIG